MPDASLLVNFFYAHPVGHAIEALRYALGYHVANPDLSVSVALTARTPTELGDWCPFIARTYAVTWPFDAFDEARMAGSRPELDLPREWDWIVDEPRRREPLQRELFPGFASYYVECDRQLIARRARGTAGAPPPAYTPHQQLRLDLPASARAAARSRLSGTTGPRIAVLPAGSQTPEHYPSPAAWSLILRALADAHPSATFVLVGKLSQDERTDTGSTRADLTRLARAVRSVDAVDAPLAETLAVVESCDLFLSPHTGFGMAALCVGTPWLTLSGGRWTEYFFNGVPFYSVLPDLRRFPAYSGFVADAPEDTGDPVDEGPRLPSYSAARIRADLPELVDAAGRLIRSELSYPDALADHWRRRVEQVSAGLTDQLWSFDGVHLRYV